MEYVGGLADSQTQQIGYVEPGQRGVRNGDKYLAVIAQTVASVAAAEVAEGEYLDLGRHALVLLVGCDARLLLGNELIEQVLERRAVGGVESVGEQIQLYLALLHRGGYGGAELLGIGADDGFVSHVDALLGKRLCHAVKAHVERFTVRLAFSY